MKSRTGAVIGWIAGLAGLVSAGCDSPQFAAMLTGDPAPDRPSGAARIEVDGEGQSAAIETAGDVDYYVFEAREGGIYQIGTEGDADTMVDLFDVDGVTLLEFDDDSGADLNAQIRWRAPEAGDYYVAVGLVDRLATGSYRLVVEEILDDYPNTCTKAPMVELSETAAVGQMDYRGDVDVFKFTAEGAAAYQFVAVGDLALTLTLFDPDGSSTPLVGTPDETGRTEMLVTIYEAGEYCLAVSAEDEVIGEYSVSLAMLADDNDGFPPDAPVIEPDGDAVAGEIDYRGDIDWFMFTAEKGTAYVIETDGWLDTVLNLFDGSVTALLATADDPEEGELNARLEWVAPEDGEYAVVVGLQETQETGSYEVFIETLPDDHGNLAETATELEIGGAGIEGEIDYASDGDCFVVRASAGQAFVVEATGDTVLQVDLYDGAEPMEGVALPRPAPFWTLLAVGQADSNGLAAVEWVAEEDQDYIAVVSALEWPTEEGYVVTARAISAEELNRCNGAPEVAVDGEAASGEVVAVLIPDHFVLQAVAGQTYRIEAGDDPDLVVSVLDTNGFTSMGADARDGALILWTAPADGAYCVEVAAFGETPVEFELTAEEYETVDDHGNEAATATEVTADGGPVAGRIDLPGDADFFRFTLEGGAVYLVETFGDTDTVLTLYAEDGETELAFSDDTEDDLNAAIRWAPEETGTFYAAVRHFSLGGFEGDYEFSVASID